MLNKSLLNKPDRCILLARLGQVRLPPKSSFSLSESTQNHQNLSKPHWKYFVWMNLRSKSKYFSFKVIPVVCFQLSTSKISAPLQLLCVCDLIFVSLTKPNRGRLPRRRCWTAVGNACFNSIKLLPSPPAICASICVYMFHGELLFKGDLFDDAFQVCGPDCVCDGTYGGSFWWWWSCFCPVPSIPRAIQHTSTDCTPTHVHKVIQPPFVIEILNGLCQSVCGLVVVGAVWDSDIYVGLSARSVLCVHFRLSFNISLHRLTCTPLNHSSTGVPLG